MGRCVWMLLLPALAAASAGVCNDIMCSSDETCCKDSPTCTGACTECCVDVSTFCVKPRPGFITSTCCSRWTVACSAGSVGCCDPARPWQELGVPANMTSTMMRKPTSLGWRSAIEDFVIVDDADFTSETPAAGMAGGAVAYALFTKSEASGLNALTIDIATGKVTSKKTVAGAAATYLKSYYGESTRLFPWDGAKQRWVFADLDRTQKSLPLVLYTIDGATGSSTSVAVSGDGCGGGGVYPVGMAWDATSGGLVLGTQDATTAAFCLVDADTGAATALGSVPRGSSEADAGFYAAYISRADAKVVTRVGRKSVTTGGDDEGVATATPAASAGAVGGGKVAWADLTLDGHGLPVSVHAHPAGGLVGLAPRAGGVGGGKLDIVGFAADGSSSSLLAPLQNAHMPKALGITLGYVGADVHAPSGTFGALAVQLSGGGSGPGLADKWALSTLPLGTSDAAAAANATTVVLSPQPSLLGAETTTLSGFGLGTATAAAAAPASLAA